MKRPIVVLAPAEQDIVQAAEWYRQHRPGFGQVFLMQVEATLGRIHRYPESYQRLKGEARRAVLRQFPYAVIYRILPDRIEVERGGLHPQVLKALEALGHAVTERSELSGDVQAVRVREDGTLEGAADPRRGGVALGL